MSVNYFDYKISAFFNHYCRKSELFDRTIAFISDNHFLKGGVVVLFLWFIWFAADEDRDNYAKRIKIISALCGAFLSMIIGRVLPHTMPFRIRPILNTSNHFVEAYGLNKATFDNLSSFPSDHCVLFFAIVTGIFFISVRMGILALLYVLLFIVFPRLYLGLHYFSDVLCGAVIGALFVIITNMIFFKTRVSAKILNYANTNASVFYVMFFFISLEIAEMFTSLRSIASFIVHPFA